MMIRMLKKDFKRNRMITVTLFVFIVLAAMLVSSASNIILNLFGSMDTLFEKSNVAHFAQLHKGIIHQEDLDSFAYENHKLIKEEQTVELLGINGANIYIGGGDISEANSVMENSFVRQNKKFDFLLDTNSRKLELSDGQIAVPVYHMQKYDLQIGDCIRITDESFQKDFIIAAFLQDSLMNPSMINSKRFLVSDGDWEILHRHLGEIEYIIEFQLHDTDRLNELETLYQDSDLPQKGTAMGYSLVKVINSMSDGITAVIIILIAILLIVIAALCLRFTMLTTIEEDYREIGVMKAIGISNQDISKLYIIKYVVMALAACVIGYLLSEPVGGIFTGNMTLYMGTAKQSVWNRVIPVLSTGLVFGSIVAFCMTVLRRFRRITVLEALRFGIMTDSNKQTGKSTLCRSHIKNVNLYLGIKEVLGRISVYGLLCFVFVTCFFLMAVPLNFLNTLKSPEFVTYMGVGKCDLRVDLQQIQNIEERYTETEIYLRQDKDVQKYSALYTCSFKAQNTMGEYDNLKIEIGDFSIFPLEYTDGAAPQSENEIALSVMSAEEYQKKPGDSMTVITEGKERRLSVCGIYQDVTNGGKTAKAIIPVDRSRVIWFTVNIDLKPGVSMEEKQQEYSRQFSPAKVTDVNEYVYQTLRGIIEQLEIVVKFAIVIAISIAALITAMFFKMLITKEARQIAIMKSLGFTVQNISTQYITRALLILAAGVVIGAWSASLLGEKLAGLLISGISNMQFVADPLSVYFLCPLALILAVTVTITFSKRTIKSIPVLIAAE